MDAFHLVDVDDLRPLTGHKMDRLPGGTAQPLHGLPGPGHHIQVLLDVLAQLTQAHTRPVNGILRVPPHITPACHGRQQAVDRALMQAGDLAELVNGHAILASAQQFQKVKRPVQGLYAPLPLFFSMSDDSSPGRRPSEGRNGTACVLYYEIVFQVYSFSTEIARIFLRNRHLAFRRIRIIIEYTKRA